MDINELMKNMGGMQEKLKEMESKAKNLVVEGESGGGLIKISMNGKMEILKLEIDPICIDPRDKVMLEDLIKAAFNDALNKTTENLKGSMLSGLKGF